MTGKKIRIGVVDNAFVTTHPELAAHIIKQKDLTTGELDANPPYFDDFRDHGTHVA